MLFILIVLLISISTLGDLDQQLQDSRRSNDSLQYKLDSTRMVIRQWENHATRMRLILNIDTNGRKKTVAAH